MLAASMGHNPALRRRLAEGHMLPETARSVAPVDTERPALPWTMLPRVGDAVTMIPPLCGDGMAMALRSAELCGPLAHDFLRGHLSYVGWQQHYCQYWQREFAVTLRIGRQLQALLARPLLADIMLTAGKLLPFGARQVVHATRGKLRDAQTVVPLPQTLPMAAHSR
jgi:flavin-dependent dehydrogenase